MTNGNGQADTQTRPGRRAPRDRGDYILIPLYPGERERLTAIAERYERTIVEEARYRLRRWLRPAKALE